jgi:Ca2+-binding RTX toxin-like protein
MDRMYASAWRGRAALIGALAAVALVMAFDGVAGATLQLVKPNPAVPATFVGKGGYSADGLGQFQAGGTVQAEVPAGSTVRRAYLYGTYASSPNPSDVQRTIDFDGTSVVLAFLPNSEPGNSGLSTARAEVTGQVAAKVGGGGGITNFAINNDPSGLDGVGLVVIYSNPSSPDGTIAVLDGGSKQLGDTTTFDLAGPLDMTVPNFGATMSLGSGFSFQGGSTPQHACGGGQFSTVKVNTQLLSNCAGHFDDGQAGNGALITVGGVGDSTNNPTPPDAPAEDDELYNLVPFLKQGDTKIVIDTANPSTDDNLFLAVIQFSARVAGTVENCSNGQDEDGDGLVDLADEDCQVAGPYKEDPCGATIDGKKEIGTDGADNITGTNKGDLLKGRDGNDSVHGLESGDCLYGNSNNDKLFGDAGADTIRGGKGKDKVNGNDGDDNIRLQDGEDVGKGGAGDDKIKAQGEQRRDQGGIDRVNCGSGKDSATVDRWDKVSKNCEKVKVVN